LWCCQRAKLARAEIGDAEGVLELLWLLLTAVLAWVRPRHDLVLENLVRRQDVGRSGDTLVDVV
jgi:hypothetical protein